MFATAGVLFRDCENLIFCVFIINNLKMDWKCVPKNKMKKLNKKKWSEKNTTEMENKYTVSQKPYYLCIRIINVGRPQWIKPTRVLRKKKSHGRNPILWEKTENETTTPISVCVNFEIMRWKWFVLFESSYGLISWLMDDVSLDGIGIGDGGIRGC